MSQISKSYVINKAPVHALRDTSLDICEGEIFGIIGHSGAGKSTLLRMLNGLEKPDSGEVSVNGVRVDSLSAKDLQGFRRQVGMIFQHYHLFSRRTVLENVSFPLEIGGDLRRSERESRARDLLERVGLASHAEAWPAQLSGGQKQRAAIARALASWPRVLLCDEITSALDPSTTRRILQLLDELRREFRLTIVLITHDMRVVRDLCHRVAVMHAGEIVENGDVADVILNPQHSVTRELLSESGLLMQEPVTHVSSDSRRVRVTLTGPKSNSPLLSRVGSLEGTCLTILQGQVSHIRSLPYAQFHIELKGLPHSLNRALDELKRDADLVEVLS